MLDGAPIDPRIGINIEGAFLSDHSPSEDLNKLAVYLQLVYRNISSFGDESVEIVEVSCTKCVIKMKKKNPDFR